MKSIAGGFIVAVGVLLLEVWSCAVTLRAQTVFPRGSTIGVGGPSPFAVATGDFREHGILDLAVANGDGSITILIGDGSGGFTLGSRISVSNTNSLVAADFNGDGHLDLAVLQSPGVDTNGLVTVLWGNGQGGFSTGPSTTVPDSMGAGTITAADFNGDGHADLAVGSLYGPGPLGSPTASVNVLLGDGSGGFTRAPGSPYDVGTGGSVLAVADFNGDHIPDLAVWGSGGVDILLGDGTGRFSTAPGSPVGYRADAIAVGDFNHDGVLDLAVATDSGVAVLLGDGRGGFTSAPGSPFATGDVPVSVATGDFDGDGNLDLATANLYSNDITVLMGDGHGSFAPAPGSPFSVGTSPNWVAVGDFDADGRADLAVANCDCSGPSTTQNDTVSILVTGATQMHRLHQCDRELHGDTNVPLNFDVTLNTCAYGCALTSTADLMSAQVASSTPSSLDDYLTGPPELYPKAQGDEHSGILPWAQVPDWPLLGNQIRYSMVDSGSVQQQNALDFLQKHLGDRVILQLCFTQDGSTCLFDRNGNREDHFVAALGPNGDDDWLVLDPGWQNASFSLKVHELGFAVTPKNGGTKNVRFKVVGARVYEKTTNSSLLEVQSRSPVELLVTDPQGRRLGNLSANNDVFEIPRGSYFRDFPLGDDQDDGSAIGDPSGVKTAYIPAPGAGNYTLQVTGTDIGPFTLVFTAVASDGSVQERTITGVTVPGSSVTYDVSYSPTPGSTMSVTPGTGRPIAGLSTRTLTFGGQLVGSTSAPQSVTLTNTGASVMAVASITASGDFAETNTCGTSLAVNASCTVSITFKPTTAGAHAETLTITDNSPDSPQVVTLSGTGQDFSLAMASGTSSTATVTAGGTANYTLSVSPQGGFNQVVTLTCGGAPSLATCSLSPASVTLDGTNAASVRVTVTTTASTLAPPGSTEPRLPLKEPLVWLGLFILAIFFAWPAERTKSVAVRARIALGVGMLLAALAIACGGGGGRGGTHIPGTPTGTYTLTISGSSGGLTHSTTVTLTVQ